MNFVVSLLYSIKPTCTVQCMISNILTKLYIFIIFKIDKTRHSKTKQTHILELAARRTSLSFAISFVTTVIFVVFNTLFLYTNKSRNTQFHCTFLTSRKSFL